MTKIKAILIDPFACEVKHVEITRGELSDYYKALSHPTMPVDLVTAVYPGTLKGRDALFVDDEGLLKEPERLFALAGAHQPFAGKGLIVGADADGESVSAETSIDLVRLSTMYLTYHDGWVQTVTPWEPKP